jgi:hypothetical protein
VTFRGFLIEFDIYSVGVAGFEPTTSCSQSRRDTGLRYTPNWYLFLLVKIKLLFQVILSGWQDSNLRPPAPKAGAIPGYATPRTWYLLFPFSKGLQRNDFNITNPIFFYFLFQRRKRDSNPRYRCQYDSLANCSFRPLRHPSD